MMLYQWAMLGSNQRPLPCEGRKYLPPTTTLSAALP
jgi:hypothetical protein